MTGRERVQRMFARQEQDRVPRHDTFWPETVRRWMGEGLISSSEEAARERVLSMLGSDFQRLCWYWPHPFPDRHELVEEDEETEVVIGPSGTIERWWKHKSGTPQHIGWECSSRGIWQERYRPALERQPEQIDLEAIRTDYARGRRLGRWTHLAGVDSFESLRKILGDVQFMTATIDDPEWVVDIARTITDAALRYYQGVLDAGVEPDGLWLYEDMAFRNMTFCSPEAYRELIWPQHKRIADWAHANGMKLIFHSDGDLRKVVELFIEAGIDCLQPLESKASMDVRELCPDFGEHLAFFGNIDVMVLLTNDLDAIEEEIRSKLTAGKTCRGYAYHSDHSVPPQVSWETYQAVMRMVDRYGRYD
jgi:uroporphyrinogen decarboxylase